MLRAILFLLLLAAGAVHAQPSCVTKDVPGGTGSELVYDEDDAGMSYGWVCGQKIVQVWGAWSAFDRQWGNRGLAMVRGGPAAVLAGWQQFVDPPQRDAQGNVVVPSNLRPVYNRVRARLMEIRAANPEQWTVAPNPQASDKSRPVYPFADGVRGKTAVSGVRAAAGSPCDCERAKSVEGSSTYCSVNNHAAQVALCRRAD